MDSAAAAAATSRQGKPYWPPYFHVKNKNNEKQLPSENITVSTNSRVRDYVVWSWLTTMLFSLFLGVIALIFSYETRECIRKHDLIGAQKNSRRALITNIILTLIGLIVWAHFIYKIVHNPTSTDTSTMVTYLYRPGS